MNDTAGASRGFSRAEWSEVASKRGEVRLNADTGRLYASNRTLAGRFLGAVRDRFRSDTELAARRDAKAQARSAAITELRSFLGIHADKLLKDEPTDRMTTDRLRSVLTEAEPYSFESRLNDSRTNVHPRAMRYLEAKISKNPEAKLVIEPKKLSKLQDKTVAQHCGKTAQRWDALFGQGALAADGRAVKLAMEVKTLANAMAIGKINNGRAQGSLAQMTFQAHAGELRGKVHSDAEFRLARELASNTVLVDLAAGRMRIEDGVLAIRVMAQKTGQAPHKIFELMKQQLDCEIGSFTREQIDIGFLNLDTEINKDLGVDGKFFFDEVFLSGDLNVKLFNRIVAKTSNYKSSKVEFTAEMDGLLETLGGHVDVWGQDADLSTTPLINSKPMNVEAKARGEDGDVAQAQSHDLLEEIEALPRLGDGKGVLDLGKILKPVQGAVTRPDAENARGVTQRQYQFLRQARAEAAGYTSRKGEVTKPLSERDVTVKGQTIIPKAAVLAAMSDRYGLQDGEAEILLTKVTEWFSTAPMTISFKPHEVLVDDPETGKGQMKYGSAYKEALEIGTKTFTPAQMQEMLGGNDHVGGLALPSNLNFGGRGVNYLPWRDEKNNLEFGLAGLTHREQPKYGAVNINFGKTGGFEGSLYYGAAHAVLKPEVRDRALFNFNKTREVRADVTTLLHDIMLNRNEGKDDSWDFMDAMVHNALDLKGMVPTKNLQLETVIFGEVDFVKDIQEIKIPSPDSTTTASSGGISDSKLIGAVDTRRVKEFYAQQTGGPTVTEYKMSDISAIDKIEPGSAELKKMIQDKMAEITA